MQARGQISAKLVQAVQTEAVLMRRDLKNAIGRGVADRPARAQMLCAQRVDNRNTRRVAIAQYAVGPCQRTDLRHQIVGEGVH